MTDKAHSPKGASSAERWMNCPGSTHLLKTLKLGDTDEPEWTGLGTAAHSLAHDCVIFKKYAWQEIGAKIGKFTVDDNMATAVQVYLDFVNPLLENSTWHAEAPIGEDPATRPHQDFYGTVDLDAETDDWLHIVDYKHGEGIIVEPEWNKQMLYYAYGRLFARRQSGIVLNPAKPVILTIVQPRAFHPTSTIRSWTTTVETVLKWGDEVLLPAMEAAETDTEFNAGSWCRFCPAKLVCPLLVGLFGAAAKADPKAIPNMSAERLALEWHQRDAVKFYMTALDREVLRRGERGNPVPGTKVVWKKSFRVFRNGAEEVFKGRFGDKAFEPAKLKSPAEMEKVSEDAKKLVKEWSFLPKTGLTIAPLTDNRTAVSIQTSSETYAHIINQETTDD